MEDDLPPNWRLATDEDGKVYYFNELTDEVKWEKPTEADAVKPEPVAAQSPPVNPIAPTMAMDESEFAPATDRPPMAMVTPGGNGAKSGAGVAGSLDSTLGDGVLLRVFIVMFCSVVVFIQACFCSGKAAPTLTVTPARCIGTTAVDSCYAGGPASYAICVGLFSLIFCCIFLFFGKKKASCFSNYEAPKVKWSAQQLFAVVLALWWTPATFVLTFFAPFTNTSNAYFAIWAAMITTVLMLAVSAVTHAHAHTQNPPLVPPLMTPRSLARSRFRSRTHTGLLCPRARRHPVDV